MKDSYITVSRHSCEEIIINKSRFIGHAAPCIDESEALDFIRSIRDVHKTATHNCYAYIIGENSGIIRYSDDGEPGGTAGLPILDVIRTKKIVNCCVVVTRYFGGVLLGTGGLVRAYTQACQAAIEAAGISAMQLTIDEQCVLPYASWDKFRYLIEHLPVRINNIEYGSSISFHIQYSKNDSNMILQKIQDASERKLKSLSRSESFMQW